MHVRAYEGQYTENNVQKDENLSYRKCEACQPIYNRTETPVSLPRNDGFAVLEWKARPKPRTLLWPDSRNNAHLSVVNYYNRGFGATYRHTPVKARLLEILLHLIRHDPLGNETKGMNVHLDPGEPRQVPVIKHQVVHIESREEGDWGIPAGHKDDQRKLTHGEHGGPIREISDKL
jgi:hypothetical protein